MTTPRFWTDPLSGASYNFGQRLTSAQMNACLTGLRSVDYQTEFNQAVTWSKTTLSSSLVVGACYDYSKNRILFVRSNMAVASRTPDFATDAGAVGPVSGAPAGGWSANVMAGDRNGNAMIGATTTGSDTLKVAVYTGTSFVARSLNASGTEGVTALVYDSSNSVWIAGLDDGTIETSTDTGVTWTSRTNANSNPLRQLASNGAGTVIGISSASTNKAVRSTDSISWDEVTLPATAAWSTIAYSPGLGKWFLSEGGAGGSADNYAVSTNDGVTWSLGSYAHFDDGDPSPPDVMGCFGNIIAGIYDDDSIRISSDGENFNLATTVTATAVMCAAVTPEIGILAAHDNTDSYVAVTPVFRI